MGKLTEMLRITGTGDGSAWYSDKVGLCYSNFHLSQDFPVALVEVGGEYKSIGLDFCEVVEVPITETDTVSNGDPHYLKLLEDMKALHIAKNKGYSGESQDRWANFRLAETLGISAFMGVLVRMSDKWIRISNLVKNPSLDAVGESVRDTLMDLASYALIAVCLLDEKVRKNGSVL